MSEIERKKWKVRSSTQDKEISFLPVFELTELEPGKQYSGGQTKEVECRFVDIEVPDENGKVVSFRMNFGDLFLFVYTCAEEELRQQLQMRYERQSVNIPYEVTFKLSQDELESKMAKRLITLTVDEITLAVARAGANKLLKNLKPESVEEYVFKKNRQLKAAKR